MKAKLLFFVAFFLVALGTPIHVPFLGFFAACIGYALFFLAISEEKNWKKRFCYATAFEMGRHIVMLSWMVSHPFLYIWAVYLPFSLFLGLQIGCLSLFIKRENLTSIPNLLSIAGAWVLLEWSRMFILTGFAWDYAGLSLASQIYSLQFASIGGAYFLSFWVIMTNLFFARAWIRKKGWTLWAGFACFPYLFGAVQFYHHQQQQKQLGDDFLSVVLVQTQLPLHEEVLSKPREEAIQEVIEQWKRILFFLHKEKGKAIDLIVFPEYIVPFSTYFPVYRRDAVDFWFKEILGDEVEEKLPKLERHLAYPVESDQGVIWMVNNAYWTQAIANIFDADVVIGLEDRDVGEEGSVNFYTSALTVFPEGYPGSFSRYEKRLLVPLGEYIPSDWLKVLAARYGVTGSFCCGSCAKVAKLRSVAASFSICYEESFGNLMLEGRKKGAELLVNLTNDGWFPDSNLPSYHLEHSRLRSVEMGVPLIRACNTGVTCAVNSLGETIAQLEGQGGDVEHVAGALFVQVPKYHYWTLYTKVGDSFPLIFSFFCLLCPFFAFLRRRLQ